MADSGKHWSNIGESSSILGMRILLVAYRLFGRWGFRVILFPVISYFYLASKRSRLTSHEYLERLARTFPELRDQPLSVYRHLWMFGEILLDKFLVWMGAIKHEDVVFENPDSFQALDKSKKGGVIIVSHLGNTEICSALAYQLPDVRVTMLVYTQHAEKFNGLLKQAGSKAAIDMLQVTDMSPATAMILAERVEAGEYIVIAGDRTPVSSNGRTSRVSFLGAQAHMPQGAFILASLLKCPVYLMFCLKHQARYHIYLETFAEQLTFKRKQRTEQIDAAVQRYAGRLENYCRLAPLQWFNFFPFWQNLEEGKPSSLSVAKNTGERHHG